MTLTGRTFRCLTLCLLGVGLFLAQPASKAQLAFRSTFTLSLSDGTPIELSFRAEPELAGCQPLESDDDRQLWRCSDYVLELRINRRPDADLIAFALRNLDGTPFNLHEYSARVVVPSSQEDALWTFNRLAERDIMETNLGRPWEYFSAANRGIPFAALVDGQGLARLALGLLGQDHVVLIRGELSANKKDYSLTLRQVDNATAELFEDTFYISRENELWFRNAQRYTETVDRHRNYVPLAMPEAALNPTYDSWYWTLDRIDQGLTWNLAVRSRALGFKTYLIDAGWDTHAGEYVKGLKGSTGDYMPPPEAFPDFPHLLDNIRKRLGMKVMLWMQQYALGRRSIYYPSLGSSLCFVGDSTSGGLAETMALCPSTYATREHMVDLFGRILDAYQPDALWFDWQEEIPQFCAAPHIHEYDRFGDGYNACQQTIMDAIRQRSADLFIDMRWPFANLNNKPYTHLWQPIDSSGDFEAMRLRALVMRPFSSGVAIGTDEMYWDPEISDTQAARFMAAVVFTGVPYFGPNLLEEPAPRTEMLTAWLRFYEANKGDLVGGDFSPYGDRDRPDQFIEGDQATFIYYGNRYPGPVRLTKTNDRLYIVNASENSGIDLTLTGMRPGKYRADISDLDLNNRRNPLVVGFNSRPRLRFDLPVGCLLTLTRLH